MDWLKELLPANFTWTPDTWVLIEENQSAEREMVGKSGRNSVVLYGSMLAVWSVIFNIALCCIVSRRQQGKRHSAPFRWLVFNFSLVQAAIGAFIIPLNIWTENYNEWAFGAAMCRVWLLGQVLLCSLSVWTLFALSVDRLLYVIRPHTYVQRAGRAGLAGGLLSAWIVSLLTLIPIVLSMRDPDFILDELCAISMTRRYAFAMSFSVFIVPALLILVTTGAILVVAVQAKLQLKQLRRGHLNTDLDNKDVTAACCSPDVTYVTYSEYEKVGSVAVVTIIINVTCVAMWTPFHVTNLMIPFCEGLCIDPSVWTLLIWLGYSTVGVTPILWFLDPDIRHQVRDIISRDKSERMAADRHQLTKEVETKKAGYL